jgi:hypothetical protein
MILLDVDVVVYAVQRGFPERGDDVPDAFPTAGSTGFRG